MSTLKQWSFKEVRRILKDNGYSLISQRGDHLKYKNNDGNVIVITPNPNKMVIRRLIKENNLIVK